MCVCVCVCGMSSCGSCSPGDEDVQGDGDPHCGRLQ